jgi:hypothetical protein
LQTFPPNVARKMLTDALTLIDFPSVETSPNDAEQTLQQIRALLLELSAEK